MHRASVFPLNILQEESEVSQLCPALCNPMDCSLPGSSIHGIFQARVLEWGAISFSRGSSRPRDRTLLSYSSCIGRWILYITWEAHPRDEGVLILPSEPFRTLPTQHFQTRTGGFLLLGEIGNSLLGGMGGNGLTPGIN